ncbi:permease-like cell division protein FtsX [Flavobacterium sp. CYK-55]|uniref:cell division protein FtsX n=1 Tax=Flavobacterium sp. CYK-55 TaxID=2835529 RepID=UPI001BCBA30E|nr:permease-like cell division protein FtsX [Flavobacterium sp. CYK-55]MBS7785842.1 permease-like cell division protein FtsX [Flavobacterium sp. CYK-55]
MSSSFEKFQKRRLLSSYFSVVLSMFLVLFLLGILGLFIINSKKLSDDFKENIVMTVFFKNEATDSVTGAFAQELKVAKFVKSSEYVTKEQAAQQHTEVIGEDFMTFLGANPLQNSFDIHLKADYIDLPNIRKIESHFRANEMVADVVYDKQLVSLVNDNINKVSMWMLIISGILALIAILLINSSMRLSIYSNRFIIKTMQMVGATKSFIRKPFIWRSVRLGFVAAVLAVLALIGTLVYIENNFPNLGIMNDPTLIAAVLAGVLAVGILLSWISTFFATQRYLNLRTDDLY